ncbi:hypothetical protein BJ912DRAFT_927161 [Pholiota molesta]|nr:hypothetical protein BJ912DRAFT_927161 [Pholiota molesta]
MSRNPYLTSLILMLNKYSTLRVVVDRSCQVRTRRQNGSSSLARTSPMSLQADIFEPKLIREILMKLEKTSKDQAVFEKTWQNNVNKRLKTWNDNHLAAQPFQLEWEAEVMEYVDYLHSKLKVHGNSKDKDKARIIDKAIPLLGPRFMPPGFLHSMQRDPTPSIDPKQVYTVALTVIHPVFYPNMFTSCPHCASDAILWDGWNATGARTDCQRKKAENPSGKYCFATTSHLFWKKWEHWKIPRSVPYFLRRAAVTHELFDLIIELRLSYTSAGLAEHLKQLHLLEHRQRMLEYLVFFKNARQHPFKKRTELQKFSSPTNEEGYNGSFITSDLITDLYMDFTGKVRQSESIEYCKTRTAKSISMDNTYKSAGKATLVDKDGRRQNPLKGGILSAINEEGEGLTWVGCTSNSPAEARELLKDIGKCHDAMGFPKPLSVVVDNCCQVRRFITEGLGTGTCVILDVHHFMMRYNAVIYGGCKNPHRQEVLLDIRNAIIKRPAKPNMPALYWSQSEQETRIIEAYNKWLQNGKVWSAAASKVHADQLAHVRKGCLARPREDIPMDGSRIEGSHKAWNSLQRAFASGIEVYAGLAHDFFLRRNIHIASSRIENNRVVNFAEFLVSTYASHHIQLINHTAELFNLLYSKEPAMSKAKLAAYPILPRVQVDEKIGLVESAHSLTFGGLIEAKPEPTDLDIALLEDIDAEIAEMDQARFIESLGVNEELLSVRMARASVSSTANTLAPAICSASECVDLSNNDEISKGPLASVSESLVPAQKRKGRATSSTPTSKRIRHIGPLSPSLGLSPVIPREFEMPEPNEFELLEPQAFDDVMDCEPTDAVMEAEVALPKFQALRRLLEAVHRKLFSDSSQRLTNPLQTHLSSKLQPLVPLPPSLKEKGLTRSQLIFSLGTSIDPRALRITEDDEFYLFMDMRAEFQWTTFGMTTSKWASATSDYNKRLEELGRKKKINVIKKNPRALMDKLNEIEPKISERLQSRDYFSKRSEKLSDTFWRKHCEAVPALSALIKTEGSDGAGDITAQKKRKSPVCSRCKTVMYPGSRTLTHLNHKKGVCSDGVASKLKPGSSDPLPDWPQPEGIFTEGQYFNPSTFLFTVRNLYERVVERTVHGTIPDAVDYSLEDEAFSRMLESRTKVIDDHSFFLLFANLKFKGTPSCESLISEIDGRRYLRMDCL